MGADDQSFEEKLLDIEIASLLSSGQFNLVKLIVNGWTQKQLKDKSSCSREELAQQLTAVRFRLAGLIDRTHKQKIYIEGRLARPLRIGYRAYFIVGTKVSVTPVVTNIIAEGDNAAIFETAALKANLVNLLNILSCVTDRVALFILIAKMAYF